MNHSGKKFVTYEEVNSLFDSVIETLKLMSDGQKQSWEFQKTVSEEVLKQRKFILLLAKQSLLILFLINLVLYRDPLSKLFSGLVGIGIEWWQHLSEAWQVGLGTAVLTLGIPQLGKLLKFVQWLYKSFKF